MRESEWVGKRTGGDAEEDVFVWQAEAQRHRHMVAQQDSEWLFDSMPAWSNVSAWLQARRQAAGPSKLGWATTVACAAQRKRRLLPDDAHHAVHV